MALTIDYKHIRDIQSAYNINKNKHNNETNNEPRNTVNGGAISIKPGIQIPNPQYAKSYSQYSTLKNQSKHTIHVK